MVLIKKCFVPLCKNDSDNSRSKLFITVPKIGDPRREQWFQAVGFGNSRAIPKILYCCEDHFNLERDTRNWMYYVSCGKRILLKKDVVPHKNILNKNGGIVGSQFSDDSRKRKVEYLAILPKRNEKVPKKSSQQTQHSTYISPENLISRRSTKSFSARNDRESFYINLGCNLLGLQKKTQNASGFPKNWI